ncbi:MAG: sugar phosphate isomerase/epimerase family protein, partial [Pirellulales bacterium]
MFKNLDAKALGLSATQSETIELALSFGFRGIDLDIAEFANEVKASGLSKARRLLDSAKLKIGSFPLPIDWQQEDGFDDELKKLAEVAALAASIGARRAVTVVAPGNDERPYHENFEFYGRRLTELGRSLAQHDLKLAVGFDASAAVGHGKSFEFIRDLDALLVLLSTVQSENVGLWLDVWQVWASGASVDEARGKLARGQVVVVSLSDADGDQPDARQPDSRRLPGETGIIDCTAVLARLAELG